MKVKRDTTGAIRRAVLPLNCNKRWSTSRGRPRPVFVIESAAHLVPFVKEAFLHFTDRSVLSRLILFLSFLSILISSLVSPSVIISCLGWSQTSCSRRISVCNSSCVAPVPQAGSAMLLCGGWWKFSSRKWRLQSAGILQGLTFFFFAFFFLKSLSCRCRTHPRWPVRSDNNDRLLHRPRHPLQDCNT